MPWWSCGYFALYVTFTAWALVDDLKTSERTRTHVVVEAVVHLAVLLCAWLFWFDLPSLRGEGALAGLFAAGASGVVLLWVSALRKHALDPELPKQGQLFVAVSGGLVSLLFSGPLLYWGFSAAVLRRFAGT